MLGFVLLVLFVGSRAGALLRVDDTEGFLLEISTDLRMIGCSVFVAEAPNSAKVADAGNLGGGISSYFGGLSWGSSDGGVGGTLVEVRRQPKLSFLRNELPDESTSWSSFDEMVCADAESLTTDLEAARARGPIGLAVCKSASWLLPSVYSSGNLGLPKLAPCFGREPEVKGVMPRLLVGEGRGTPSFGSS